MIKLDDRLGMLYDMVINGSRVVDVGTDHGYLISKLILSGKCPSGKGVDINLKPLQKAEKIVSKYKLNEKIELLLSSGLDNIKSNEVDNIIVAGMGSHLIVEIIDKHDWVKNVKNNKYLILQPMSKPWLLRRYLYKNGYEIIEERLARVGKFYYVAMGVKFKGLLRETNVEEEYMGKLILHKDHLFIKEYFLKLANQLKVKSEKILKYEHNIQESEKYKKISIAVLHNIEK